MKQYVIDQLRLEDHHSLKTYLDDNFSSSGIKGLYWIPLDDSLLTNVQKDHSDCNPFHFAAELDEERLSIELLVRTQNKMHCHCMTYADEKQRNWLIDSIDAILEKLTIHI